MTGALMQSVKYGTSTGGKHSVTVQQPRKASRWRDAIVLFPLLGIVGFVYFNGIARFPDISGDEGIYTAQAWSVLHGSLSPYTYWYDHPPVGWMQLGALLWLPSMLLKHTSTVIIARHIMGVYALVDVALVYGIARRLGFRRVFAALAVTAMLSPLAVVELRQVYIDGLALPWVLGAFYVTLSTKKHLWQYLSAGLLFAVAVLTKETTVLVFPALLCALWLSADRRLRLMAVVSLFVSFGSAMCTYPLFAILRHELFPGANHVSLWDAIKFQLVSRAGSGSVFQGEKHALFMYWQSYDRYLIVAGVAAGVLCLAVRRFRALGIAVVLLSVPVVKSGGYLPGMYVIVAIPFLVLAVTAVISGLWQYDWMSVRWSWLRGALRLLTGSAVLACLMGAGVFVVPAYGDMLRTEQTVDEAAPGRMAEAWMVAHVQPGQTILAEAAACVDLAKVGWSDPWKGAAWYTQLDLDPSAKTEYPNGWQNVSYVIATTQLLADIKHLPLPQLGMAIDHSTLMVSFGSGEQLVQIYRVNG